MKNKYTIPISKCHRIYVSNDFVKEIDRIKQKIKKKHKYETGNTNYGKITDAYVSDIILRNYEKRDDTVLYNGRHHTEFK